MKILDIFFVYIPNGIKAIMGFIFKLISLPIKVCFKAVRSLVLMVMDVFFVYIPNGIKAIMGFIFKLISFPIKVCFKAVRSLLPMVMDVFFVYIPNGIKAIMDFMFRLISFPIKVCFKAVRSLLLMGMDVFFVYIPNGIKAIMSFMFKLISFPIKVCFKAVRSLLRMVVDVFFVYIPNGIKAIMGFMFKLISFPVNLCTKTVRSLLRMVMDVFFVYLPNGIKAIMGFMFKLISFPIKVCFKAVRSLLLMVMDVFFVFIPNGISFFRNVFYKIVKTILNALTYVVRTFVKLIYSIFRGMVKVKNGLISVFLQTVNLIGKLVSNIVLKPIGLCIRFILAIPRQILRMVQTIGLTIIPIVKSLYYYVVYLPIYKTISVFFISLRALRDILSIQIPDFIRLSVNTALEMLETIELEFIKFIRFIKDKTLFTLFVSIPNGFRLLKRGLIQACFYILSLMVGLAKSSLKGAVYVGSSACLAIIISGILFDQSPADVTQNASSVTPVYVSVHAKENTTFSSETSATIKAAPFRLGDTFTEGSILLEFDCRVQRAELRKAKAQLEAATSTTKSAEKLKNFDSISEQELIKARTDGEIASAEVEKLTALVDKCTIKAPYNGVVSETLVHAGESVKPGDPLIKIVNVTNLELQMQVPSVWLEWLKAGTEFKVTIDEIKKTFTAKVTKINPEIDPISQTVKIIGVVTTPNPLLLPGMSGKANFSNVVATATDIKSKNKVNHHALEMSIACRNMPDKIITIAIDDNKEAIHMPIDFSAQEICSNYPKNLNIPVPEFIECEKPIEVHP